MSNYVPFLSKSLYIKGLQCHKALWLQKNRPELKDDVSESQQAAFDSGTDVGILAQRIFPHGTEVPYDGLSVAEQLQTTRKLILDGERNIYEAAFSFDGTFCKVDILHRAQDGWELYEVKGSTGCKAVYLDDIALQYHVMAGAGTVPVRAFLVHLNGEYVRHGAIDVSALFTLVDVTAEVAGRQERVATNLAAQRAMLDGEMPAIDIGPHCSAPYECAFAGHCWAHIPENSVFSLRDRGKPNAWRLYREGIVTIDDVPEERLGWRQKLQQRGIRETFLEIEREKVAGFLATLRYPLCFMDFETVYLAPVPLWDGMSPYQQIPFQYSLHVVEKPGQEPLHYEFLADGRGDPRPGFLERLLAHVPKEGSVIVWNAAFETSRLRELSSLYPEQAVRIQEIIGNMVDLMNPFRNKSVYHSGFNGSYSIKAVLPALVPDLTYENLEVSNGAEASAAWLRMTRMEDQGKIEALRIRLLEYCRLDTLAMVMILEKMGGMITIA